MTINLSAVEEMIQHVKKLELIRTHLIKVSSNLTLSTAGKLFITRKIQYLDKEIAIVNFMLVDEYCYGIECDELLQELKK